MKLVRFGPAGAEKPGLVDADGALRDASALVPDIDGAFLSRLDGLALDDIGALPIVEGQPRLGPCVTGVGKFIGIGLNYADHAAESGLPVPSEPIVFLKANSCLSGPNDAIRLPAGAAKTDWEVELGVVIGQVAHNVRPADALRHGLKTAVDRSFNQITVDGDESTNDTCAILANGASGGDPLETGHHEWPAFQTALTELCQDLAKRIPADGEGATKLVTINVHGTADGDDARTLARGVAASILVKCAIHGNDPNWGRIIAALGQQGIPVDTQRIQIDFAASGRRTTILDHGEPTGNLVEASEILSAPEITIDITVGEGPGKGLAWGCDMTTDYVTFNAEYHT